MLDNSCTFGSMIFPAIYNLHLVRGFPSQPCLISSSLVIHIESTVHLFTYNSIIYDIHTHIYNTYIYIIHIYNTYIYIYLYKYHHHYIFPCFPMISPWSPMKSPAFRFVLWQNHQLRRPSSSGLRCDVRQAKSRFSLNVPDQRQGMPSDRSTGPKSILWKKNFGSFGSTKTRKIALLRKLEVGHIYVVNHAKPLKFNFLKIVKTKSDLYSKQHILYWPTALPIAKFHSPTQNMTTLSQRSSPYFYCELNGMIPFFFSMVELELAWVSTKMSKCVNTQWCTIDCQVVSNKHISYIYICRLGLQCGISRTTSWVQSKSTHFFDATDLSSPAIPRSKWRLHLWCPVPGSAPHDAPRCRRAMFPMNSLLYLGRREGFYRVLYGFICF